MEMKEGIPSYNISMFKEIFSDSYCYDEKVLLLNNFAHVKNIFALPFRFEGFSFMLCRGGAVTVVVNQCEYRIGDRMVLASFPDDIINIVSFTGNCEVSLILATDFFIRNLHLDLHQAIPLFIKTRRFPVVKLDKIDEEIFDHYLTLLEWATGTAESPIKNKIVDNLAASLIYAGGNLIREHLFDNIPDDIGNSRREIVFSEFTRHLLENYRSERSVKFYADKLHITPKYLSSLIKDVSGRSATEWIDDYVIVEAKNLLKFSNLNIQEIAYSLNFDSQSFFGKYFKQHTGYSPSQYKLLK